METISISTDIDIYVRDINGQPIEFEADYCGELNITLLKEMTEEYPPSDDDDDDDQDKVSLDQYQAAIRSRYPELTFELEQIRNDLALQNGEVKP